VQELTPQEKAKKITVELFSLQSSPPFEAMLAEEVVQDYVLQHLSVRKQELKEASLHLSAGMGPLDSQDEWRKQDAFAKADATVDEVLLTAKDTVLQMPTKGQQFQDLLEKMSALASAVSLGEQLVAWKALQALPLMKSVASDVNAFMDHILTESKKLRKGRALFTTTVLILALKLFKGGDPDTVQNAKKLVREQTALIQGGKDSMAESDIPLPVRALASNLLS
ncbi:unnamed protein product, partial [Durusdinium trenchii]